MTLDQLNQCIVQCKQCPRLVAWQQHIAQHKKNAYRQQTYWSQPVPSFGDPQAHILILGLAPGAHGANRTGRMFTGDASGEWLYRALYKAGLSNQQSSVGLEDGLKLKNTWISNVVRCVPPDNKPLLSERNHCLNYLRQELLLLTQLKVILCLGQFAYDNVLRTLHHLGHVTSKPKQKFAHALCLSVSSYTLICSYHPSQQNTRTKKLSQAMFDEVFSHVHEHL